MNEFQSANSTSSFAESQHILRIHDSGPFATIILPYRKTEAPVRSITQQTCGVQVKQGTETTCFNDSGAMYANGVRSILTAYDGTSQTAFGVTVSGGSQEVTIEPGQIVWTISGNNPGARSLTLAGNWYSAQPVTKVGSTYSYTYSGGPQAAPVTIVFTPAP
jgi:hypothetical protein